MKVYQIQRLDNPSIDHLKYSNKCDAIHRFKQIKRDESIYKWRVVCIETKVIAR